MDKKSISTSKPIIFVDGSSYLYRAFHALPALANSKGFQTGAIFGIVNMLRRLLTQYQPEAMAVVFDAKGKTFRDELYEAYKATRQAMPDELISQIDPIHQIIQAMGLPLIMVDGVEADDVIGTLAKEATKNNRASLISTGDKDLAQLVNTDVTLINTMTNTLLDPEGVKNKFGVPPDLIIDYLTLVGDTSDNIPGVPNVGPKTAAKWLQTYGSLDNIIAHAEDITGKVGENLRASLSLLPLTKQLVTIKCDVPLSIHIADLNIKPADEKILIQWFKELEFKGFLSELLQSSQHQIEENTHYVTITTEEALQTWLKKIAEAKLFAFDTETTSLDYMRAQCVGVSFAMTPFEAAYIPFGHDYPDAPKQLSQHTVLSQLKPILENESIKKIGQHIKYDMEVMANIGIHIRGVSFDTMLESYILDSSSNNHDMDSLALKYLGLRTITFEDVAGSGQKQVSFNQVELEKASTYAAQDADVTLRLHQTLYPRIEAEPGLKYVFNDIEIPLIPVLARMERYGVLIDPKQLSEQGRALEKRLMTLQEEAFILANKSFNINSPKQLQEILFQDLQLPILQKTPKGQASTADHILQELALDFALPRIIIEYRSLSKLISTYTTKLIEQINPKTKRIHTSYNQTGAATGRLSSSNPNLQNIPIRSEEGRRIRQAFIAPKGYRLISADYSQIELRLMAHISQDPRLLEAFNQNLDIHQMTASEVWGVPLDAVTSTMRREAKAINFGLIYGMSAFGLTRELGINRKAAEDYIERYFARYPKVKAYMEHTRQEAKEKGYVETLWGRRLYLPDINSSQIQRQKSAERTAINAPLQGSAADIIKLAMIQIDRFLLDEKLDAKMIMQVHDELVFEANEQNLSTIIEGVTHHMMKIVTLSVPLTVSIGIGDHWDEASRH